MFSLIKPFLSLKHRNKSYKKQAYSYVRHNIRTNRKYDLDLLNGLIKRR